MKKILIIEDNHCLRQTTAEILELADYQVIAAENGVRGIELALKEKPHLILCDIVMPQINGYEVLGALYKSGLLRTVPFIFLSGKTDRQDFRKGMELGADDYLTKPYSAADLLKAVDTRLRKAESIRKEIVARSQTGAQPPAAKVTTLDSVLEEGTLQRYRKKQNIYQEGGRPQNLYYVQKGKVKTFKCNDNGRELAFALYGEGEFFGYAGLLDGACYRESAEAMEVSEIIAIPKQQFEDLIAANSEVSRWFIRLLARDVTDKEEQLLSLAYNSLRKKVAKALVMVSKKFSNGNGSSGGIYLSRENLANIAGTATESLIRTLTEFKNEKLIDIANARIVILNESGLLQMK